MRYFFILGRNPQLSLAELASYFERENLALTSSIQKENSILIETDAKLDLSRMIQELGGTIAIGEVSSIGKKEDILKFINKNEIYFGEEIKFNYSLINFADEDAFDIILQDIKDKFKEEKLKAFYRSTIGNLDIQEKGYTLGTPKKIKSKDIVYFLFKGSEYNFGEIKAVYDSNESEKRDITKPVRREELAISPRLAKILINLSQVKKDQILLDPFCGIGGLVMESVLQEINAIGIDNNKEAIIGARRNLEWLKNNYKINAKYELINADSKNIGLRQEINGIASEPSLGELLKTLPPEHKAKGMTNYFENLIIGVLNNLKSQLTPGSKIAFTSPLIKTRNGKVSCNIQRIVDSTHLKLSQLKAIKNLRFPIEESRKDSIVARDFWVLER